jgi:hypothetical protein
MGVVAEMTSNVNYNRILLCSLLIVLLLCVGVGSADEIKAGIEPILKVKYEGATPIKDATASKASSEKAAPVKVAIESAMKDEKYPIQLTTEIKILKYRCDAEKCGYWISATRGGKEVATNSPIWLINGNAPIDVVVSEVYDEKTNEQTITLKEDPKAATMGILQAYVERCPIGKATTGTRE